MNGNPLVDARGIRNPAVEKMESTNKEITLAPKMLDEMDKFYNSYKENPIFELNYRRALLVNYPELYQSHMNNLLEHRTDFYHKHLNRLNSLVF
jgi:hypothetical protein